MTMRRGGGFVMRFEERRFVQVRTLCERWDCGRDLIYDLVSKQRLQIWHPDKKVGNKGVRVCVQSVLDLEKKGMIGDDG
jgi:hypothetical protein